MSLSAHVLFNLYLIKRVKKKKCNVRLAKQFITFCNNLIHLMIQYDPKINLYVKLHFSVSTSKIYQIYVTVL